MFHVVILQTHWNHWTKSEMHWGNTIKSQHRSPWIKAKIISYKKEKNYSKTSTAVFLPWLTVKSKTKDWLLYFYISLNPVLWIWPQVLIHITMDVFISQTSWEESSGESRPDTGLPWCHCMRHPWPGEGRLVREGAYHIPSTSMWRNIPQSG